MTACQDNRQTRFAGNYKELLQMPSVTVITMDAVILGKVDPSAMVRDVSQNGSGYSPGEGASVVRVDEQGAAENKSTEN